MPHSRKIVGRIVPGTDPASKQHSSDGTERTQPKKFQNDVVWSIVGVCATGVSGILLSLLVGLFYDAAALGVFNQVFAAYIFFSQLAVGGLHYSALKSIAEYAERPEHHARIVLSALAPALVLSLIATVLYFCARHSAGRLLESPGVAIGLAWSAPGLFFFSLNKVLLSTMNGLRYMRAFALLQSLRPLVMILTLIALTLNGAVASTLPAVLSAAEIVVFLAALCVMRRHLIGSLTGFWSQVRAHVNFGARGFAGGFLTELNTRVDVLMLGFFMTDHIVGLYSFAAILVEGFFQLLVVLRNNFNPILVQLIASRRFTDLRLRIQHGKLVTYVVAAGVTVAAIGLFPLGQHFLSGYLPGGSALGHSWPLFSILMIGVLLGAGYVPFSNLLLQAGRPGLHTCMLGLVVLSNALGNLLLIPWFGAIGAAVATAFSFVFSAILLRVFTQRFIGVRI
jgi:O-antigen/teichoic acid export membrane protein